MQPCPPALSTQVQGANMHISVYYIPTGQNFLPSYAAVSQQQLPLLLRTPPKILVRHNGVRFASGHA